MKPLAFAADRAPFPNMAPIPGGVFSMGSNEHYPEEAPAHKVRVGAFWMDKYAVTNARFRRFVDATGYETLAKRPADPARHPDAMPEMLLPSSDRAPLLHDRRPARRNA
jgi:sulfatase modifying factor 1